MNYKWHYEKLIEKGRNRCILKSEYSENHHIIPKSIGGKDDDENLIQLFAEEHLLAHLLLVKIYPDSKELLCASNIMTHSNGTERQHRTSNKQYGWLKRRFSKMMKESMKGENNHRYGVSVSDETKQKISDTRKENGIGSGEKNPMFGKNHSKESKKKISENRKGKGVGSSNSMFGKNHSEEVKKKLRDKNLKTWRIIDLVNNNEWI